ncbi:uncharacterized protein LOC126688269 [Mercurialis annua]|uniref:uncharacterized protein LOC126688269 n=1 Tax=Mercurialis annua TaxID=3986 RepID=UPI00215F1967|nr:uncharacterized protein LOC126688269 [Mercurialis annua]
MALKPLLVLFLLLIVPFSSGMVEGFREITNPDYSIHKVKMDGNQMNSRKLLVEVLDYDDTGPNPKHDPRKKGGRP